MNTGLSISEYIKWRIGKIDGRDVSWNGKKYIAGELSFARWTIELYELNDLEQVFAVVDLCNVEFA